MTYEEHLIENAICSFEKDDVNAKREFMENWSNKEMAGAVGISLEVVWDMAQYCCTTLRQDWEREKYE